MKRSLFFIVVLMLFVGVRAYAQESYRNPYQRGVSVVVEGFAGAGTYPGVGGVIGYHFGPGFFAGAGANVKIGGGTQGSFVPFYADFRASFGDRRWAPYVGVDLGAVAAYPHDSWQNPSIRPFTSLSLGARMRNRDVARRSSLWLAAIVESSWPSDLFFLGLRAGYSF